METEAEIGRHARLYRQEAREIGTELEAASLIEFRAECGPDGPLWSLTLAGLLAACGSRDDQTSLAKRRRSAARLAEVVGKGLRWVVQAVWTRIGRRAGLRLVEVGHAE